MSRKGRALIYSVITPENLKSFVSSYRIPSGLSPRMSGPTEPITCSSERIVIHSLSFSVCGVWYLLSSFKMERLNHYGILFSQVHPLAFLRIVHFELTYALFTGVPTVPLYRHFYCLRSDGDWFTYDKRQDSVSLPCYSFILTSTYPKEWKIDSSLFLLRCYLNPPS
ncbi:hypothetical protein Hdeb2414_s0050g00750861 [Helianthus debilis subsp. tardiflorus]